MLADSCELAGDPSLRPFSLLYFMGLAATMPRTMTNPGDWRPRWRCAWVGCQQFREKASADCTLSLSHGKQPEGEDTGHVELSKSSTILETHMD